MLTIPFHDVSNELAVISIVAVFVIRYSVSRLPKTSHVDEYKNGYEAKEPCLPEVKICSANSKSYDNNIRGIGF